MSTRRIAEPDWLLRISYPTSRRDLEDVVERVLFLSCSAGSSIEEREGRTIVRLYFSSKDLRDEAMSMFPGKLEEIELVPEETEKVDWLEYYEHSLEPIEIGRRWIVAPDRRLVPEKTDRVPLVIPQERAFGTGAHETTYLCLAMMESMELEGRSVIDVGTGSGILAIGMQRLGAGRVIAFDNDPETWGVVRENMMRNAVPDGAIECFFGTVESLGRDVTVDLIVMNIIPEVILPSLPLIASHLVDGGSVIFSGVLTERAGMVEGRAGECGLDLIEEATRGDWWCGRFEKLKIEN